jgi:hypothetical protein
MGEFGRLSGVFFEPQSAFADIAARPRFIVPLILLIIGSVAFITLFSQRVGWERYMRQKMETSSRMQNLSTEQREQAIQMQVKFAGPMGTVGAVLGTPVIMLIVAGITMFTARMMLSAPLTFKQVFGITAYSWLPGLLPQCLAIVVILLKNPDDFNLENPTAFNVGAFLDPQNTAKWIYSLAGSIDLFTFWIMALLATGLWVAAGRKPAWSSALLAVLTPWLIWVLIKAGASGLFS